MLPCNCGYKNIRSPVYSCAKPNLYMHTYIHADLTCASMSLVHADQLANSGVSRRRARACLSEPVMMNGTETLRSGIFHLSLFSLHISNVAVKSARAVFKFLYFANSFASLGAFLAQIKKDCLRKTRNLHCASQYCVSHFENSSWNNFRRT